MEPEAGQLCPEAPTASLAADGRCSPLRFSLSPSPPLRARAETQTLSGICSDWQPQWRFEDLATQFSELREDFATLSDCLRSSGLLTARELAMQRRARRGAATFQELLRASAVVQHLSVVAGPEAMSNFAATCSVAAAGLRSLLLLPGLAAPQLAVAALHPVAASPSASPPGSPEATAEAEAEAGAGDAAALLCGDASSSSTTTAEGLEDEPEAQVEEEAARGGHSPGPEASAAEAPAADLAGASSVAISPAAAPSGGAVQQQAIQHRGLTTKLITGLLMVWRRGIEEVPDPPDRVAFRLPEVLRSVARFGGCAAARRLAEAAGRPGAEVFRGGALVRELAGQGQRIYVCGSRCGAPADCVEIFHPAAGTWDRVPRMQVPRRACAATSAGGRLFVMGGVDVATPLEEGQPPELLDPVTGTWTPLPHMGPQFTHAAAAACGGFVYVFGGLCCGSVLDQAQRFDTASNVWEALDPMPTPRFECAAAAMRRELYVLGGANVCGDPLTAAESYSPATGRWQALPPLGAPRFGCAAAAVRGVVYVIGGHGFWESSAEAECFNPDAGGSWQPLPPMPIPRNRCAAAAADGRIYIFGGNSNGSDLLPVHCFDPEVNEWSATSAASPTSRDHCIAAAACS